MKYQSAPLRQMLSAQYALGTLQGRARRRFQRLLREDPSLQREVAWWEERLVAMVESLPPVAPRGIVWAAIDHRINAPATPRVTMLGPAAPAGGSGSLNLWRNWALAATLTSLFLGYGLWRELNRPPQVVTETRTVRVEVPQAMPYVAMLQPAQSSARWVIAMMPEKGLLKVAALGSYDLDHRKHCLELWVLDEQGRPHSLGVLPMAGEMDMPMPEDMPMPAKPMLAVSMEPTGGSPTGQPTGPVILSTPALRAS